MPGTELSTGENTTLIEELLQLSADIGVEGTVLFGGLLLVYFAVGVIVTAILGLHAPYPFLSLEADPVLLIDGTIIGIFTVQAAGSLLLYHSYVGLDNKSVWSVVLSLIALGLGGSLLQMTLPEIWNSVVSFVLVPALP
ncbi:MAG: hypothetical protein V5A55_01160 [Halovenus sp.]